MGAKLSAVFAVGLVVAGSALTPTRLVGQAPQPSPSDTASSEAEADPSPDSTSPDSTSSAPANSASMRPEAAGDMSSERGEAGRTPPSEPSSATATPKVAVLVVGDADPTLVRAAERLEALVEQSPRLRQPVDAALRGALRGAQGSSEDGYAGVRRQRRSLGMSESEDIPALTQLGRRTGAIALVLVRSRGGEAEMVMYNVEAAAFYSGFLLVTNETSDPQIGRFISRRTQATLAAVDPAASSAPPSEQALGPTEDEPEEERDEVLAFFEQAWPFMVAGALLVGLVTAILLTQGTDAPAAPVLRFGPGGN